MKAIGIVTALVLNACSGRPDGAQSAKPLRIHVVDAQTGRPLSGVRVVYAVQTVLPADIPWWAPPLGGPYGPRLAYGGSTLTDLSGDAMLRPVLELKADRERVDQLLIYANLNVDMASEPARRLREGLDAHCGERPEVCSRADADIQVAAHLLSGGADVGDSVFLSPITEYRGEVIVLNVDPKGAERPQSEEWGAALHLRRLSAQSVVERGTVLLRLSAAASPPTRSKARFQK